ncbi:MAG: HAD family hydrolase, partial [Anaerolineales bacterium]|nr:HAD family hydrolase [Anaerolineales bacterium]
MNVEAIIFDIGGTLRERVPDEKFQAQAAERFLKLLGKADALEEYWMELARCQDAYSEWAQERLIESSEEEIWTRWMTPELPRALIAPNAVELMIAWRDARSGRATPRPDAHRVIAELSARGYRLGVISNTTSSVDVPRSLEAYGLRKYFDVVVLSSTSRCRKPAPEIFWQATRALNIDPACCAYVGDRISRDVVGSKRAGFAKAILIEARGAFIEPRDG